jgi:hypothetical protein
VEHFYRAGEIFSLSRFLSFLLAFSEETERSENHECNCEREKLLQCSHLFLLG